MKNIAPFAGLLMLIMSSTACYRPHHIDLPATPPKFSFSLDGVARNNGVYMLNLSKGLPLSFYMHLRLISGNPINYPISVSFSGLPSGFSPFHDFTTMLNCDSYYYIPDSLPKGTYPFMIKVRSPDTLIAYPAHIIAQ